MEHMEQVPFVPGHFRSIRIDSICALLEPRLELLEVLELLEPLEPEPCRAIKQLPIHAEAMTLVYTTCIINFILTPC